MATKKDLTKEEKIKREFSRLKRIFKDLDKNKLQTVESLIKNAAFMAVSLEELQEIINEEGYTVEYQNGANQSGTKQSDAVKTHSVRLSRSSVRLRRGSRSLLGRLQEGLREPCRKYRREERLRHRHEQLQI